MNQQKLQQAIFNLFLVFLFSTFANAQSKVVPIIDMKVGGLLGGVQNGKYLDAETTVKTMAAETDYTLYLLGGSVERVLQVKKPKPFCPDGFYNLDFSEPRRQFFQQRRHGNRHGLRLETFAASLETDCFGQRRIQKNCRRISSDVARFATDCESDTSRAD